MRFVPNPARPPHRCAFLPTIAGFHPKGFVEGTELFGGDFAYISLEAVEQIAAAYGWAPRGDVSVVERRVGQLQAELEAERARVAELEAQLAAVEVLKAGGFTQARKPGRPRKEPVHP